MGIYPVLLLLALIPQSAVLLLLALVGSFRRRKIESLVFSNNRMIYKCSGNLTKTFLSPIGGRKVFLSTECLG